MSFSVKPLGGLGQIGSNMLEVLDSEKKSYVIDCGILFPSDDILGINYLIPNFENLKRPEAILITHGHEDHIGALPHLFEKFPGLNVYAPPFAAELIRRKSEYFPRKLKFNLNVIADNDIQLGELTFSYIQVNHSIPDTYGILIKKANTCCFYVSDFKVDHKAKREPPFNFRKLLELSKDCTEKVLMADSTNITSSKLKTLSEEELRDDIKAIFARDNDRIFLTTFSSNLHRITNIANWAHESGRKVSFYGRSLHNYFNTGLEVGEVSEDIKVYDIDELDLDKDKVVILISGCQADFRSTLRRVASGNDSKVKLKKEDLFVFSSKSIPGNEKNIIGVQNQLASQGIDVINSGDFKIHASGHAGKKDLEEVIQKFSPTVFIPIHGETLFLKKHREWVQEIGLVDKTYILLNQDEFNIATKEIIKNNDDLPPNLVMGKGHIVSRDSIRERRKLAEGGTVLVSFCPKNKEILSYIFGVPTTEQYSEEFFQNHIHRIFQSQFKNKEGIGELLRIEIRKVFTSLLGVKPVVKILIHQ